MTKKYAVHLILVERVIENGEKVSADILEEQEAVGCGEDFDTYEEAVEAFKAVQEVF